MTLLEFCVEVVISCALSLFLYLALDYRVVSLVLKGGLVPSFRLVVAILRARAPPPPLLRGAAPSQLFAGLYLR